MISWWKKIVLSLESWIAGAILGAALMVLQMLITNPPPMARLGESVLALTSLAPFFLLLSFFGWLVALPGVILVNGFCRWRFWMYLALGTCIGPALWLIYRIFTAKGASRFDFTAMPYPIATVSFLIALIYILLFQRAQGRAATKRRSSGAQIARA